ncbi:MAG: hypothetical protein AB7P04_10330 [Bacteriovoracia bacterium]
MKITLSGDGECGTVEIPAGEYLVSVNSQAQEIVLAGRGKTLAVKATKRRSKSKYKTTQIQFYSGGGTTWSLVVSTPKYGEFVSFIEVKKRRV